MDAVLQAGALLTSPPPTPPQQKRPPHTPPLRVPVGFSSLALPVVLPLQPQPPSAFNIGSHSSSSSQMSTDVAVQRGGGTLPNCHWASSAFAAAAPSSRGGDAVSMDYGMQVGMGKESKEHGSRGPFIS